MVQVSSPHEGRSGWGSNEGSALSARSPWDRLYVSLLAGPSRPKIKPYQGDSPPYGALWISRITGPRDPATR